MILEIHVLKGQQMNILVFDKKKDRKKTTRQKGRVFFLLTCFGRECGFVV